MKTQSPDDLTIEFTPLEKIEVLYNELVNWYGEADKKELRVAAKLLIVALEKFSIHAGAGWQQMVQEYVDILKQDPDKFERILESNRGELKQKKSTDAYH
ncbi:hypothetical protein [Methylophaga sp. OBS1]|jgi:hypothetical protein|uniref:hypothetical protein n=1 Tax=Methylophaga sp. OBS1 TaxID=2991933 RepID=UPI0022549D29|nr:hypothetical protein [Methylophaga sp. OBS1]MCX4191400.1 hypothetical protein [Methylophaga sp. OBS1]MCX4191654.1 hypothetical protein [Methylophaga sp. OBS1]